MTEKEFEKGIKEEAEELFKKKPLGYEMKPELEIYTDGFKDGAEFGYNKANEWHYPSKGEYPIDKTEMLVYFKYADYEYPCKTFGFYNGHFWDTKRGDVSNKDVIAWKEIVLPELEENKE